jgi:heme/copper-type cytochrome/quinol oxidase subunit 3
MSAVAARPVPEPAPAYAPDVRRGTTAMALFIANEAMLFVMLFFAYFYLGYGSPEWHDAPPKLTLALAMLVVLVASSLVLAWGERQLRRGGRAAARAATAMTVLCGLVFLGLQALEYHDRLQVIRPSSNAYGSTFYALTGIHGLHVTLGVLMLVYVLLLPEPGEGDKPPHRPLHNAALYWHFVDVVWVLIVALLYVVPHFAS